MYKLIVHCEDVGSITGLVKADDLQDRLNAILNDDKKTLILVERR